MQEDRRAPAARVRRFVERMMLSHIVAYPMAFTWMCAVMPPVMLLYDREIARLEGDVRILDRLTMPAGIWLIVSRVLWVGGVAFAATHGLALPWALGGEGPRGRRFFIRAAGVLAVSALLIGASSWGWLYWT